MTRHLRFLILCVAVSVAAASPAAAQHFSYVARHAHATTQDGVPVTMIVSVFREPSSAPVDEAELRVLLTTTLQAKGFAVEELDHRRSMRPSPAEQYWVAGTLRLSFRRGGLLISDGRHRCEEDRVPVRNGPRIGPVGQLEVRETRIASNRVRASDPAELAAFVYEQVETLGAALVSRPHRRCRI